MKERFDKIFFTGGARLGTLICQAAAKHLTPCTLELGGKSPAIICPSADITVAARRVAWGAFLNSGQTCVRPDYVCVHSTVADRFLEEVQRSVRSFYGEDPQQSDYFGRIITDAAHQRLQAVLKDAETKARIVGGRFDAQDRFIQPTVLDFGEDEEAFKNSEAMAEEIFGPIMPVLRFTDLQRVVDFIRGGEKPLSIYPFTVVKAEQELILRETSSGGCDVNDVIMRLSNPNLPFGGVGRSGMGAYHGVSSFNTFTHRKSVNFKTTFPDLPVRYPPYVSWKRSTLAIVQQVRTARQWFVVKATAVFTLLVVLRRLGWPADIMVAIIRLILGTSRRR
jgi:aldehyde dehydrogenase (NAD+)